MARARRILYRLATGPRWAHKLALEAAELFDQAGDEAGMADALEFGAWVERAFPNRC